jgi:aryl-alcohol dehydrogenase-like predicted oxidoreductase
MFSPENRRRVLAFLEQIRPIAEERGATLAQLTLAWTLARPGLTHVLAGARNAAQVDENAGAGDIELSPDEIATIDGALAGLTLET